jgi:carboxymethylenebutenolidase
MNEPVKISQEMIRLYDEYTHLTLDRRDFINKLIRLTGSAAAAAAIVPLLEANQARAAIVAQDDARLKTETVSYPGAAGEMTGYLARQVEVSGKLPAVIVIHENRGLNPHLEDVVRRIALEGFLALGPDFLSPMGGTPANEDQARDMIGKLDQAQTVANAVATVTFLRQHPSSNGKVGAIGFCWGGGLVNQLAVNSPDLAAGVAYYGRVPEAVDVAKIKARMLLHYAGLDERINEGIPAYSKALQDAKVEHQIHVYEGANHAFNNDTSEARYNKEAADLAWSRTVEFLKAALS